VIVFAAPRPSRHAAEFKKQSARIPRAFGEPIMGNHHSRHSRHPESETFMEALTGGHKPDYKTMSLCKLVGRIVQTALTGEVADETLQDLTVLAVQPAPNAGRLMVVLMQGRLTAATPLDDIYARLQRVQGLLRSEIAQSTARKRTPELAFIVMRRPEVQS
jgi:ribosome-binding factor A